MAQVVRYPENGPRTTCNSASRRPSVAGPSEAAHSSAFSLDQPATTLWAGGQCCGEILISDGVRQHVRSHGVAHLQNLYGMLGQPIFELLIAFFVRDAVAMPVDLDKIITTRSRFAPFSQLISLRWRLNQYRALVILPAAEPTSLPLREGAVIEFIQQCTDRHIEFGQ